MFYRLLLITGFAATVGLKPGIDMESSFHRGDSLITFFMCGDVMLGRGIDQILPHPGDPVLHESYVKNARRYVDIAERKNGAIPRDAGYSYVWGDALQILDGEGPDLRMINLETSITESDDYMKRKGIHYRMHPDNVPCLTAAGIDLCALGNNHVMDWGYDGLVETLEVLDSAGIRYAGAGLDVGEAEQPAIFHTGGGGRGLVVSCGATNSGVPGRWAAGEDYPGLFLLNDFSDRSVSRIKDCVENAGDDDVVIVSIHWGSNWGYSIPSDHVEFAHRLIDEAGVDIIHGHSSHHVKGIEVYRGRLILYGCGDFLNDYEGISGHEKYRGDLSLMYFVSVNASTGELAGLKMVPTQTRKFRVSRATGRDAEWLYHTLDRECEKLGTCVVRSGEGHLVLDWNR